MRGSDRYLVDQKLRFRITVVFVDADVTLDLWDLNNPVLEQRYAKTHEC